MARMFPEWISEAQREANPKFRAEFKVYDALAKSLASDDWYVFYSRTWTWVEQASQRLRTREADFIIAHPDCGILLLEVKGGRIEVRDGQWISIDRYGESFAINPYDQVASAASALQRRLSEEAPRAFRDYRFSTAVCFPDVDVSEHAARLGPGHRRLTLDATDLRSLDKAIVECMRDGSGRLEPPGEGRVMMLKQLVADSWYIHAPKFIQIHDTEDAIKQLTETQFTLLYQLGALPRLLVSGCAGSGKTMMAAHIARQMVLRDKRRVLFVCYNKNLSVWVRASSFFVDNGMMLVTNYQKLCVDLVHGVGEELPQPRGRSHQETDHVYKVLWPERLLAVVGQIGEQFDAIIVDEGQDFYETWWEPLLFLLKEGGSLHVYYDPQQWLWGPPRALPAEVTDGAFAFELTQNVRNTKPIHDLAMSFHPSRGHGYQALCAKGLEPEFVPVPEGEKEHQTVRRLVEHLVEREGGSTRDIAILTPLSLTDGNSFWKPNKTLLGKYLLVHHLQPGKNQVFCSSIGAAKGLEFPVVILTELHSPAVKDEVADILSQLYVGISRARSHVIVIGEPEELRRLPPRSG